MEEKKDKKTIRILILLIIVLVLIIIGMVVSYFVIKSNDESKTTETNNIEEKEEQEEKLLSDVIKEDNGITNSSFDTSSKDKGLLKGIDDDGDTYYFRGTVENNYIKFNGLKWTDKYDAYILGINSSDSEIYTFNTYDEAKMMCDSYDHVGYSSKDECINDIQHKGHNAGEDMLFRIVRINGDRTIRLIADGSIGKSKFNEKDDNEKYVGYTYDNSEPNKQDGTPSTVKQFLDNWYDNTMKTKYDEYIATSKFCSDVATETDEGYYIVYKAVNDTATLSSFKCSEATKTYGGKYNLKIGLITSNEVNLAGGVKQVELSYLSGASDDNWMMSPTYFRNTAHIWGMYGNGSGWSSALVSNTHSVRPVINLKSDLLYTEGNGTKNSPYVVG